MRCIGSFLLAAVWLCSLGSSAARAETLFGVVSERSAAVALAAAHRALDRDKTLSIRLRTPEQLAELSDAAVSALWADADALLFANVFGEQGQRLARLLRARPLTADVPILALAGELDLTSLSRIDGKAMFAQLSSGAVRDLTTGLSASDPTAKPWMHWAREYPPQAAYIEASAYWQGRQVDNVESLWMWLLSRAGRKVAVPPPKPSDLSRYRLHGLPLNQGLRFETSKPVVVLLDYEEGDGSDGRKLHDTMCEAFRAQSFACLSVLARWGEGTARALEALPSLVRPSRVAAVIALQDFVLGGGDQRERASRALTKLDVPVIKAVRLFDRSEAAWRLSSDGLSWDSVNYRLSMPELQGTGQPTIVEAAGSKAHDARTGLVSKPSHPITGEINALAARVARFRTLRDKPNREKRVAIVYYNHPPGRHNVGADNLDVPASLWEILQSLRGAGYGVSNVPATPEALLARIQQDGINLPEDRAALASMAQRVPTLSRADYEKYFATLPESARLSVVDGPLGRLRFDVERAWQAAEPDLARARVRATMKDVHHVLEGSQHRGRARALDLLRQLEVAYERRLTISSESAETVHNLTRALIEMGIEGLRGWGPAPGRGMVHADQLVVPGLRFGNVFIGPQPPRGWELDEELLHANLSFAPPHQYLAYYRWLREVFQADVVIHVGRHSTYEFLPGPSVGVSREDFSRLVLEDLPSIYLYIVDGVGEGIQAKRRGNAVIVDHLTPPLSTTPLYDELLTLRQLVESFEAAGSLDDTQAARSRAVREIRTKIEKLNLQAELRANMTDELKARELSFEQVSDELLVHEVGHYLTELQERFMPFGLHVFGRPWKAAAVEKMLTSMSQEGADRAGMRKTLVASPLRERATLLSALSGHFVEPGHGNDPIRRPEVLPTGRNFHALDGGLLPTRVAYELGAELAASTRVKNVGSAAGGESVVLWASDTVRDEGVMVAFGLDMLGVRPVWNSRGILRSLERVSLEQGRVRRDVSFVTSGLFRDLYENLIIWLDRAVLLSLDGSSQTIQSKHPELAVALAAALAPLGELRAPAGESLAVNQLASHWVTSTQALLARGMDAKAAGREASIRLFGNAPGGYGAGVNNVAERSGAWEDRSEIASVFALRMAHGYGAGVRGEAMRAGFEQTLARTERTFLGRASHLYGLLDNNDGFDYLGGLRMAVESRRGSAPTAHVVQYADRDTARVEPVERALFVELRGRHLNPEYLKSLMPHGYAGARTMSSGFMENLWGWQVTSPDIVRPWVWEEVQRVYLEDGHGIGLTKFLDQSANVHVKANLEAIMLVAAHKGFWTPDQAKLKALAEDFARIVSAHGLPGSGHTRPDHPVMGFVLAQLGETQRRELTRALQDAQQPAVAPRSQVSTVSEIRAADADALEAQQRASRSPGATGGLPSVLRYLLLTGAALLAAGFMHGRRKV